MVEHVTRAIAEEPDAVEVELVERRDKVALLVHADPTQMASSADGQQDDE